MSRLSPRRQRVGVLWILGPHTGPLLFDAVASLDTSPLAAARYHGDQDVAPGVLDFAVNVRHDRPPEWLVRQLAALLPELARYPSTDDVHRAQDAVAERHGRTRDEVLPLVGAAEGFALLHNLSPVRAAIVVPAFTEPAIALSAAGITAHHVVLKPPFVLDTAHVPDDADLVVVGNPTNPTSVLHLREQLLELRRPDASWWSTRRSLIGFPASRNRWLMTRCPMCWCSVA